MLTTGSLLRWEAIRLPFCVTRRAKVTLRYWHAQLGDRLAALLADRAANVHPLAVFPHEEFLAVLIGWTDIEIAIPGCFPLLVHV